MAVDGEVEGVGELGVGLLEAGGLAEAVGGLGGGAVEGVLDVGAVGRLHSY